MTITVEEQKDIFPGISDFVDAACAALKDFEFDGFDPEATQYVGNNIRLVMYFHYRKEDLF